MAPLSQGLGYGLIIGIGAGFAFGMIAITRALTRYQREVMSAEEFATAGRSVGSGLIASAVISSWCWPTSMLVSSGQAYTNGICGGLYYASGCGSVCYIFAILAMEVKRKAPGAHTYLELIRFRFGKEAHFVFMFFAWAMSILITAQLQIGAATVINYLSDVHMVAAIFLGVLSPFAYTFFGGLMATFITDYVHTLVIILISLIMTINFYITNLDAGKINGIYEKLSNYPTYISGNAEGSLLTLRSHGGGIFLLYALCSCIPLITIDQGYWNKALAASPRSVLPGYIMGGLSWYAMPFAMSAAMGLAVRVLENTPAWTLPKLTSSDVSAGLTLPAGFTALLGRNGAVCGVILILMSVTSTASAEMVAVSSIWTYDVYKTYLNPKASDKQLIFTTHASVVVFVLAISGFSTGLYYGGVDVGWLFDFNSIVCGGAVVPALGTLFWKGLNKQAVIISPILGLASGIACWLGVAAGLNSNKVDLTTTAQYYPGIAGMLIAIGSPILYIAVLPLIFGNDNYDFELMKSLQDVRDVVKVDESGERDGERDESGERDGERDESGEKNKSSDGTGDISVFNDGSTHEKHPDGSEKSAASETQRHDTSGQKAGSSEFHSDEEDLATLDRIQELKDEAYHAEERFLDKYIVPSRWICFFIVLSLCVIWPIPMYASKYVFSRPFFRGWVSVSIMWLFLSFFLVGILPLIQGRRIISQTARAIFWDLTGQKHKIREWQRSHVGALHQNFETPEEQREEARG